MHSPSSNIGLTVHQPPDQVLIGEYLQRFFEGLEVIGRDQHCRGSSVPSHHDSLMRGHQIVHHFGQAVLHLAGADSPTAGSGERGNRREHDSVRSKIWYGGGLGLAATVLVAIGLAALFDLSFWAALGITALIGLGLVMLLAVLVG